MFYLNLFNFLVVVVLRGLRGGGYEGTRRGRITGLRCTSESRGGGFIGMFCFVISPERPLFRPGFRHTPSNTEPGPCTIQYIEYFRGKLIKTFSVPTIK